MGAHCVDCFADAAAFYIFGKCADYKAIEHGLSNAVYKPERRHYTIVARNRHKHVYKRGNGKRARYNEFGVIMLAKQAVYKLTDTIGKRKAGVNKTALVVGNAKLGNDFYHTCGIVKSANVRGCVYEPTAENKQACMFFCKIFQNMPP